MNGEYFTAPRHQAMQERYQIGDRVLILDPVRLAYRLKTWPLAGARGRVERSMLDQPARVEALGTTSLRLLIGWNDGHSAIWIDRDEVAPAPVEEVTAGGRQVLVGGTPRRVQPTSRLRPPRRQADLADTPLFGQERAALERTQLDLGGLA